MSHIAELKNTDILILCGGLGTRFRQVMNDRPKGLAPVAGKPILEILIDEFTSQGAQRIILGVGYMKTQIIDHFKKIDSVEIIFSQENEPLGTGGAILNALPKIESDRFLVSNGDSICDMDYNKMIAFHDHKKSDITIAVSPTQNAEDYGNIDIDDAGKITAFTEKVQSRKKGIISAGVYLLPVRIFKTIEKKYPLSIEIDLFPQMVKQFNIFGYRTGSEVLDIGTEDRYGKINHLMSKAVTKTKNSK